MTTIFICIGAWILFSLILVYALCRAAARADEHLELYHD